MKKTKGTTIYKYSKVFFIAALLIIMAFVAGKSFFTFANLTSVLQSASLYGIMACGMMFPLLLSGPDLSISGGMAVGGMVAVKYMVAHGQTTQSFIVGIILALLVGACIGAILGSVCHFFKVPSFLISLSLQYILYGIAQIGLESRVICMEPEIFTKMGNGRFLNMPVQVFIFIIVAAVTWFLMHHTVYGRKCYMIGGNKKASTLCGIKSGAVEIGAFAISGLMAAFAGVILAAMNQQANSTAGRGYETQVLLGCVLGGGNMGIGIGSIPGAIYGAVFVALLNNCMRMGGVKSEYQTMIVGALIIASMAIEGYFRKKATGMHWNRKKTKGAVVDTRDFA